MDENIDDYISLSFYLQQHEYKVFFVTDFLIIAFSNHDSERDKSFFKAYEIIDFSKKSFRTHIIQINPENNNYPCRREIINMKYIGLEDAYIRQ